MESVVSQVVKNWEVDTHHVADPAQWSTVDISNFKFSINDDPKTMYDAKGMAEVGPYVALLQSIPGKYEHSKHTFESTNKLFSETFTEGRVVNKGGWLICCKSAPLRSLRCDRFYRFFSRGLSDLSTSMLTDLPTLLVLEIWAERPLGVRVALGDDPE